MKLIGVKIWICDSLNTVYISVLFKLRYVIILCNVVNK